MLLQADLTAIAPGPLAGMPNLMKLPYATTDVQYLTLVARIPSVIIAGKDVGAAKAVAATPVGERATKFIAAGGDIGATITTHHLVINRNHLLVGGIRPHYYCLPVAKRESHRLALRRAATSGDPRFFSGTDSAPHPDRAKESACGCAGCFTAPNWLPIVAQVFQDEGALDRLEGFVSLNGAAFYGLAPNEDRIRLVRRDAPARWPARIAAGDETVTVFDPGFPIHWHIDEYAA